MAKVEKKDHKVKDNSGKADVKRGRSAANNILKESDTLAYRRRPANVFKTEPVSEPGNNKRSSKSDNNDALRHGANSILMHSTAKPESRMTTFEKMEATRKGISKKELEELKKRAGLDYDQLSHILQVARATLIAKKGSEKFPGMLSEKIMSVADIYSYGYSVFGNDDEFNKWIFHPISALGGKTPYDILDNVYGREEVKHIIGRIEYGVYS